MENVRGYWYWAVSYHKETEIITGIESLWLFYDIGNRFHQGEQVFAYAVTALKEDNNLPINRLLLGKLIARQGALCYSLSQFEHAETLLVEAIDILSDYHSLSDLAFCFWRLSTVLFEDQNPDAEVKLQVSLRYFQDIDDTWGICQALTWLGMVYQFLFNDLPRALAVTQQSLTVSEISNAQRGVAEATFRLGQIAVATSEYEKAAELAYTSLATYQQLGIIWGIAASYRCLGWAQLGLRNYRAAYQAVRNALAIEIEYQLIRHSMFSLGLVAEIFLAQGKYQRALELLNVIEKNSEKMRIDVQYRVSERIDQLGGRPLSHKINDPQIVAKVVLEELIKELDADHVPL